jgi:inorganic pyrophosphatase
MVDGDEEDDKVIAVLESDVTSGTFGAGAYETPMK